MKNPLLDLIRKFNQETKRAINRINAIAVKCQSFKIVKASDMEDRLNASDYLGVYVFHSILFSSVSKN